MQNLEISVPVILSFPGKHKVMMLLWPAGIFSGNAILYMLFLIHMYSECLREMSIHDGKQNKTVS